GAMFGKLWPRLLKATATEAFAEMQKDKKFDPVAVAAVHMFFAEADKGKASSKDVSAQIRQITQESERNVQFDTRDRGSQALIRRNILAKGRVSGQHSPARAANAAAAGMPEIGTAAGRRRSAEDRPAARVRRTPLLEELFSRVVSCRAGSRSRGRRSRRPTSPWR